MTIPYEEWDNAKQKSVTWCRRNALLCLNGVMVSETFREDLWKLTTLVRIFNHFIRIKLNKLYQIDRNTYCIRLLPIQIFIAPDEIFLFRFPSFLLFILSSFAPSHLPSFFCSPLFFCYHTHIESLLLQ